jgi:signal transduction histidine kinase
LPYKKNSLTFVVNALEYTAPFKNKVRFMMEGVDQDWLEENSGISIRYPNLQPGSYTLKVQAGNSDEVFNDEIRMLAITITPPFHRTWWFYILIFLAGAGLIALFFYLNFRRKLEVQKTRLRLYENLHDDVGSRLTAIVLSAEEVIREDQAENPKLLHIHKVAKSIVNNMRRLVWAIDPENDTMTSMVQKIRYDKSLILDERLPVHIELPESMKQMILPGEVRYQLSSIVNEALNNISKYAEAKNAWIRFQKVNSHLHMQVEDDGKGFDMQETGKDKVKGSGYGLGNMHKRIERVKGEIEIQSAPGKGTRIDVRIPLE